MKTLFLLLALTAIVVTPAMMPQRPPCTIYFQHGNAYDGVDLNDCLRAKITMPRKGLGFVVMHTPYSDSQYKEVWNDLNQEEIASLKAQALEAGKLRP